MISIGATYCCSLGSLHFKSVTNQAVPKFPLPKRFSTLYRFARILLSGPLSDFPFDRGIFFGRGILFPKTELGLNSSQVLIFRFLRFASSKARSQVFWIWLSRFFSPVKAERCTEVLLENFAPLGSFQRTSTHCSCPQTLSIRNT